ILARCLELFSITTIESSTSIHSDNINAKRVILLISSQKIRATINTIHNTIGIQNAAFKAFLYHKNIINKINTIAILTNKFIISSFVASFAVSHSF
ncbi:MAG: hypothetical protein Q8M44_03010, partial [bacterium]|nr:hypothetical protein [bacterium]